ncbi:M20/M25/M40 family metallo-hydrolase [Mesorhizobium sp. B4-1-4]|uniref:M20/M25/M40 family metallo-hydrolase n=1 Tax=Mesorhizobium sp. B4-1-4 TaxID=2589888 RepID=UPI0021F7D5CC|nr:M20/M25/M40 family metallo-hydrolase [Mesorhizobium sp. B4-1-4]
MAEAFGAEAEVRYDRYNPVTFNHSEETDLAIEAVRTLAGTGSIDDKLKVRMGAEDFAHMLEARPGAYIFIGNGASAGVHNPAYDFNDDAIPYGIGYWVTLAEKALSA